MDLKDKVAIITGASRGIGRATALALAQAGANVSLIARNGPQLKQLADEIRQFKRDVFWFVGDLSLEEDIKSFTKGTIEHFGKIDILINNAGLGHFGRLAEFSTLKWDEMFNLNVRGVFIITRECLPYLRAAGEAAVVNIAFLSDERTAVGGGAYAASKQALLTFSHYLMQEERTNGIRVLTICPRAVATDFSHETRDDVQRLYLSQPEDIAASILFMIRMPQRSLVNKIEIQPTRA